jgi:diketogulonate reductase-like aldo/keto reductase
MTTPDTLRDTRIPLNNGSGAMPAVGFGTLIPDPVATKQATKTALEVGFRHFDCAERYRNEEAVGEAMQEVFRAGVIRREDVFVTTKLWNTNHRPERVKPAFDGSRRRLQVDTVDCYIIHTPFAFRPGDEQDPRDERGQVIYDSGVTLLDTWGALERLVDDGKCKSIGLSDVSLEKLREIVAAARIKPAVVQVESHPYLPEWELLDFCREQGIVLLAFAALGMPWILNCWMMLSSQALLGESARRLPKWRWPGPCNAARRSSRPRPSLTISKRTSRSQRCPRTRCRRFGTG